MLNFYLRSYLNIREKSFGDIEFTSVEMSIIICITKWLLS